MKDDCVCMAEFYCNLCGAKVRYDSAHCNPPVNMGRCVKCGSDVWEVRATVVERADDEVLQPR